MRHRRRPSSHLAPGRPALARRADAAAHLRPLRADPPRLSDRGISRRPRRRWRRQIGLCPDQLGQGAVRGRGRLGAAHRRGDRLAARDRRLCGFRRRRRRGRSSTGWRATAACAACACNCTGTRTRSIASPPRADLCADPDDPAQYRARSPTMAGASTCRCSRRQMPDAAGARRGLPEGDVRAAARRHAGGPVAAGPLRMARRHGAAGGLSECRLRSSRASAPSCIATTPRISPGSCARRWRSSAPSAACSARTFRSRSCGRAIAELVGAYRDAVGRTRRIGGARRFCTTRRCGSIGIAP